MKLLPVGTRAKGWGWEPDTRAALAWLESKVKPGMSVADIGTGTGILAIRAAELGGIVTAFERDSDVQTIAARNFNLNPGSIDLIAGEWDGEQGFDLVVANLGDVEYGDILTAGEEVWTTPPSEPRAATPQPRNYTVDEEKVQEVGRKMEAYWRGLTPSQIEVLTREDRESDEREFQDG